MSLSRSLGLRGGLALGALGAVMAPTAAVAEPIAVEATVPVECSLDSQAVSFSATADIKLGLATANGETRIESPVMSVTPAAGTVLPGGGATGGPLTVEGTGSITLRLVEGSGSGLITDARYPFGPAAWTAPGGRVTLAPTGPIEVDPAPRNVAVAASVRLVDVGRTLRVRAAETEVSNAFFTCHPVDAAGAWSEPQIAALPARSAAGGPIVSSISPKYGWAYLPSLIRVKGTNLGRAKRVTVGGRSALGFWARSSRELLVITPILPDGAHEVLVTTAAGTSPQSSGAFFTNRALMRWY